MENDQFIFCLEAVPDVENFKITEVEKYLVNAALNNGISNIYKTCDTIEGLEDSLNTLLYDDHNFKNYEIIYLVMQGENNNICIHDFFYSLDEIAELFEGKMKGKIIHFANTKILDLTQDEAQFFSLADRSSAASKPKPYPSFSSWARRHWPNLETDCSRFRI